MMLLPICLLPCSRVQWGEELIQESQKMLAFLHEVGLTVSQYQLPSTFEG
jgi:hypothetical protein